MSYDDCEGTGHVRCCLEISHEFSAGGWLLKCEIRCEAEGPGSTDGDDSPDARDFYILATTEIVGSCALWWRPDGKGYTCELEKAGLYTRSQASSHRKSDVPIHRSIAESIRVSHVRVDDLHPRVDGRLVFGPNGGLEQG